MSIAFLATVIFGYINPIAYNNTVEAVGLNVLMREEPYIEVDHCKMYDGDTVSFQNGAWITSEGCQPESIRYPNEENAWALTYINASRYEFDLLGSTTETPISMFQDDAGQCVLLIVFTVPSGVRLEQGCASILTVDQPATYQVNFRPGIPKNPGYMGDAIGRMNDLLEPLLPCYEAVANDEFKVVIIQDGLTLTSSGNLPDKVIRTESLPEAGKYYIGLTIGEDLSTSIFDVPMHDINSCTETRWREATAEPGTSIVIENP